MCNPWCLDFAARLGPELSATPRILEVGSRNVNGSVRDVLGELAGDYVGVDLEAGPGVDRVGDVLQLDQLLQGDPAFDLVISTEMLEHCPDWHGAVEQLLRATAVGGLLAITTRSPGFHVHGYPDDYWRFTPADLRRSLGAAGEVVLLENDRTLPWPCGVGIAIRRQLPDAALPDWARWLRDQPVQAIDGAVDHEDRHSPERAVVEPELLARTPTSAPAPADLGRRTHRQIERAARLLGELEQTPGARAALEARGFHLERVRRHPSLPTDEQLVTAFDYAAPQPPFADPALFDESVLRDWLERLMPHAGEFDPPQQGDPTKPTGFFWDNPSFGFSDAVATWAMLRELRPARVIDVGGGIATWITSRALDANGFGRITCVGDDLPAWLDDVPRVDQRIDAPVTALDADALAALLGEGDVLFLRTSHLVRTGSDCAWLYLRLLPALPRTAFVHVHDTFLPGPYPLAWQRDLRLHWNEQHLLLALLRDNPRAQVLFGSQAHLHLDAGSLERFMHGRARPGGSSLWFRWQPRD